MSDNGSVSSSNNTSDAEPLSLDDDFTNKANKKRLTHPQPTMHAGTVSSRVNGSEPDDFAHAESRNVHRSKMLLMLVLMLAAVSLATTTLLLTRAQENDNFELEVGVLLNQGRTQYNCFTLICNITFNNCNLLTSRTDVCCVFLFVFPSKYNIFSGEIVQLLRTRHEQLIATVDMFASTYTSQTVSTQSIWPFVYLPNFGIRGKDAGILGHTLQIGLVPLVTKTNRLEYQEFVSSRQGWIREGLLAQNEDIDKVNSIPNISSFIHQTIPDDDSEDTTLIEVGDSVVDYGPADYAPIWQQTPAPLNPSNINFDMLQHPSYRRAYRTMWETRSPVFTEVTDSDFFFGDSFLDKETDPHSFLFHPIYPNFDSNSSIPADDLVGFLYAAFSWRVMLERILRNGKFYFIVSFIGTYFFVDKTDKCLRFLCL
jgi:hypothetical protein